MVVAAPGVGQLGDALAPATVGSSLNQRVRLLMYLTTSSDLMVSAAPGVGQLDGGYALAPRQRRSPLYIESHLHPGDLLVPGVGQLD
jgi:hypothetical protein